MRPSLFTLCDCLRDFDFERKFPVEVTVNTIKDTVGIASARRRCKKFPHVTGTVTASTCSPSGRRCFPLSNAVYGKRPAAPPAGLLLGVWELVRTSSNIDGSTNENTPNVFNDLRMVIKVAPNGVPNIEGAWEATTEPGRHYTQFPLDRGGAARIAFGQHKAWSVGFHRNDHEGLVQTDDVAFYRDLNKDFTREGDRLIIGMIGLNQHWGYDLPRGDIGHSSAGCLVGRTPQGHREFMKIIKADPRYEVSRGYKFMTTVIPASALTETDFDPASQH
jgi:hypothetical protein